MFMKRTFLWLIFILAAGSPVALYLWRDANRAQPHSVPAPAIVSDPAIRYPIEDPGGPAEPLPALGNSDDTLRQALTALFGQALENLLIRRDIARSVVATVDNLPRDHVSPRLMPVRPPAGLPLTTGRGKGRALAPENAARYRPYVRLVQAVPAEKLVAVYTRFYPLLQEQYEALGYPDRYFNDRVVEVIDHLLATPEIPQPLVTQRRVLYEFTDPALEKLSAGQKMLLRIGSENRTKVKGKLIEIRQALTSEKIAGDLPMP
jgi:hypothetical protein